jgi:hypothetical protein
MTEVPTLDEVLKDAPKNWGKWGDQDEVGALNYLTAEEVVRGVRHIKSGTVFTDGEGLRLTQARCDRH